MLNLKMINKYIIKLSAILSFFYLTYCINDHIESSIDDDRSLFYNLSHHKKTIEYHNLEILFVSDNCNEKLSYFKM